MTMERTITLFLLLASVEGEIKHTRITTAKTWSEAQAYCRLHYTDLSFVGSQRDQENLLKAAGRNNLEGWIGLHRPLDDINAWIWSGGESVTYVNWSTKQPDNSGGKENAVQLREDGKWNDCRENYFFPFYCMTVPVVKEKMSWEEALEYCRANQSHLPNPLYQFDLLEAQRAIQLDNVTDPTWIGLRYLNDVWLWMSGDPLVYSGRPPGAQDDLCPLQKRCGALTKSQGWTAWDCQDTLSFICI